MTLWERDIKLAEEEMKKADFNNIEKFAAIQEENAELYALKNADYGNSFSEGFAEYGILMAIIRLEDKLRRIKRLCNNKTNVKNESIIDTLSDLSNYAIMTIIELDKQTLSVSDKS